MLLLSIILLILLIVYEVYVSKYYTNLNDEVLKSMNNHSNIGLCCSIVLIYGLLLFLYIGVRAPYNEFELDKNNLNGIYCNEIVTIEENNNDEINYYFNAHSNGNYYIVKITNNDPKTLSYKLIANPTSTTSINYTYNLKNINECIYNNKFKDEYNLKKQDALDNGGLAIYNEGKYIQFEVTLTDELFSYN